MGEVAAVDGCTRPAPSSPGRVAAANLLPVVALGAAVYGLLPRLAKVPDTTSVLRGVQWPWLVVVVVAAASTYLLAALGLRAASGLPLPRGQATAAQLAAAASNRVLPAGLGAVATNIRYVEASGAGRAEAVAAVVVTSASGIVVHALAAVAAFAVLRHGPPVPHIPAITHSWPALMLLAAVSAVVGLALSTQQLRSLWNGWVRIGVHNLAAVAARPRRAAFALAANAGITAAYVVAFDGALRAFGVHLGLCAVAAVYLGGSAVGAATPAPGGVGPFEAAAVAGLGRLGVAAAPAVAGVITYRLITYWLPVAPGAVAFRALRRRRLL
jgi:undecaprenyl-diphosphatase